MSDLSTTFCLSNGPPPVAGRASLRAADPLRRTPPERSGFELPDLDAATHPSARPDRPAEEELKSADSRSPEPTDPAPTVLPSVVILMTLLSPRALAAAVPPTDGAVDPAKTVSAQSGQAGATTVAAGWSDAASAEPLPGAIMSPTTASIDTIPNGERISLAKFGSLLAEAATGAMPQPLPSPAGGREAAPTSAAAKIDAGTVGARSSGPGHPTPGEARSTQAESNLTVGSLGARSTTAATSPIAPISPPGIAATAPATPSTSPRLSTSAHSSSVDPQGQTVGALGSEPSTSAPTSPGSNVPAAIVTAAGARVTAARNDTALAGDRSDGPEAVSTDPRPPTPTGLPVTIDTGGIDRGAAAGDGSPDRPVRYPAVPDQLAPQIMLAMAGRRQSVSVQLHPTELGVVQIRISVDASRRVKAVLSAANPATVELLQRHASGVERALTDAGLTLVGSDALTFDLDLSQQGPGGHAHGGPDEPGLRPKAFERHPVIPTAPVRYQAALGLVDLVL